MRSSASIIFNFLLSFSVLNIPSSTGITSGAIDENALLLKPREASLLDNIIVQFIIYFMENLLLATRDFFVVRLERQHLCDRRPIDRLLDFSLRPHQRPHASKEDLFWKNENLQKMILLLLLFCE